MGIYDIVLQYIYVYIFIHHMNVCKKYTYIHIYLGIRLDDKQPKIASRPLLERFKNFSHLRETVVGVYAKYS